MAAHLLAFDQTAMETLQPPTVDGRPI